MNFGQNLQTFFSQQILAVFLVVLAVMAVFFFIKKETGKFIGFLITAIVCAVFVVDPQWVVDLFVNLAKTIFG